MCERGFETGGRELGRRGSCGMGAKNRRINGHNEVTAESSSQHYMMADSDSLIIVPGSRGHICSHSVATAHFMSVGRNVSS